MKDISFYVKSNSQSISTISKILKDNDIELKNCNILEIGSGWFRIMPYLFKQKFNVNQVFSYDINEHYSKDRSKKAAKYIFGNDQIFNDSKYCLPEFLNYYPNTSIINAKIEPTVEFVFSRFVLEHITPKDILKIHESIFNKSSSNIKILHLISPSDHRAYTDESISHYDFLKYSQDEWDKIQTKFDYHNRLRLPEYLKLFEKSGFEIKHLNYDDVNTESYKYKKFKELKLNDDFKKFNEKDILAGNICVLLSK